MSRIGRMPVAIPAGVTVEIVNNYMTVKGPKGTLERQLPVEMEIKQEDGNVIVTRPNDLKKMKRSHKNLNRKHDPRRYRRLREEAGSKRRRLQSC